MDAQLIIGIAIAGAILLLTLAFLLIRRNVVATIAGFSWQRKVWLEHYIWVKESSYRGFPEGSRNQQSTTETYFVNQLSHYNTKITRNADGSTTTTSEPVYQMVPRRRKKYTYEIQRWCPSRELHAEGETRSDLYWPSYVLDSYTQERLCKAYGKYNVFFQSARGKKYRYELPEDEWTALDEQTAYQLRVTLYGKVTRCVPDPTQTLVMSQSTR